MSFLQNTDAFQQDPYLMERKRQAIAAEEARARMGAASAIAKVAQSNNTVAWVPKAGVWQLGHTRW
jgi:hypothetical protein